MQKINLNYLYIGLLKNSELGLVEILQEKTNYRRVEMTLMDWNFLNKDTITNAVKIEFPQATNNWGLLTHFGIFNSFKEGKLLVVGNLCNLVTIDTNQQVEFNIGKIEIPLKELLLLKQKEIGD